MQRHGNFIYLVVRRTGSPSSEPRSILSDHIVRRSDDWLDRSTHSEIEDERVCRGHIDYPAQDETRIPNDV
jgi:hypothetical protein